MSTRMDRYKNLDEALEEEKLSRVKKNDSLYEDIKTSQLSRVRTNNNVRVIEAGGKTINIDKIKKYLEENNETPRSRRHVIEVQTKPEVNEEKEEEPKEYDINSVLEKAKRSREIDYESERYKKLRDTQFDILSKIKMYEESQEEEKIEEDDLNTEERTLVDLINTVTIHKNGENLLEDLIGSKNEEVTLPIEEERTANNIKNDIIKELEEKHQENIDAVNTKESEAALEKTKELVELKEKTTELDRSFFTNSMTFSKEDFEGFEELERNVKKNNVLSKIMVTLLIILVIVSLVVIVNYVFNLGLF